MDTNSLLTVSQLSNELDSSEVIIKFIVKRFKQMVPATSHLGQSFYNEDSLITLIFLLDKINRGVLPSTIEKEFKNKSTIVDTHSESSNTQKNISFQERTVRALEKRAEAEEKKVLAMNNIATAINQFKASFLNNSENPQNNRPYKSEESSHLFDLKESESITNNAIDDLSMLIEVKPSEENPTGKDQSPKIDDLASLLDKKLLKNPVIDDLSVLIAEPELGNSEFCEIDDLSLLLDTEQTNNLKVDDLSALIPDNKALEVDSVEIDDLSVLIQKKESNSNKIDDLSILIQGQESNIVAIDDLSALIRNEKGSGEKPIIQKPKSSPKDEFEKYKSEIINIIIDLKEQGLTEEETCEQFNLEGILTFAGKTKWSVKTISQIYQLIENAA